MRRRLHTFGPGTEDDLVWWLGATKTIVRAALGELDDIPDPGPWVALLAVLARRSWAGGRAASASARTATRCSTRGNPGTTAWTDGRAVGCWVQDEAGRVHVRRLDRVPARARRALDGEAKRRTEWLEGVRIGTVHPSPAVKRPETAVEQR